MRFLFLALSDLAIHVHTQFRTNTLGAIHTINAFLPLLLKGQSKKIIVVSSKLGLPSHTLKTQAESATAYSVSKAALNMVVTKFAVTPSLKEQGLIIVGVEPGFMKSYTFREHAYFHIFALS